MGRLHALVEIDAAETIRLAQAPVAVTHTARSKVYRYRGGIKIDSLPDLGNDDGSASIAIPSSLLDASQYRQRGAELTGSACRVYIWEEGTDFAQAYPLLSGRVKDGSERRTENYTTVELGALEATSDRQFPPHTITDSFRNIDVGQLGNTLPIIIGSCSDVGLIPTETVDPSTSALRLIVAGHRIASTSLTVRLDAKDSETVGCPVYYASDAGSGASYSYVTLTQSDWFGRTNFLADVQGMPGRRGSPVCALGDVLVALIKGYSGLPPDRIDWDRIARAQSRLNRIVVASAFGGQRPEGLVSTLKGRYEPSFPVSISWRGGRLGFDYLDFDEESPVVRRLAYGRDLIGREGSIETDAATYSRFGVRYDWRRSASQFSSYTYADPSNSALCAAAQTRNQRAGERGGIVTHPDVNLVDVNDPQAARIILSSLVQRKAVPRNRVTYCGLLRDFLWLPLMERYLVSDSWFGWSDVSMRLESIGLDPSNLEVCKPKFASYRAAV